MITVDGWVGRVRLVLGCDGVPMERRVCGWSTPDVCVYDDSVIYSNIWTRVRICTHTYIIPHIPQLISSLVHVVLLVDISVDGVEQRCSMIGK